MNGTYDAGYGYPFNIDFHKHLVTTQGFEERVFNPIILVLKNSDGSLVINIYGAEQSQRDGTMVTNHRSLLLAPMGVNIQKNWQTGDSITDNTDANYSRLAVAMSYDYGESYEMTPAYQSFQNNDSSKMYYLKK